MATCGTIVLAQQDRPPLLTPAQASAHREETATVCGLVAKVSCGDDGVAFRVDSLETASEFRFFVPQADWQTFNPDSPKQFDEQRACATGRIERTKSGHQIVVRVPDALRFDDQSPAHPSRFGPEVSYGCEAGAKHPTLKRSVRPVYPSRAVAMRMSGIVHVKAVVNTDGTVGEVALLRGLDSELDAATLDAVRKFQFSPGTLMGSPVRSVITFEMEFR
jgi:protein TonB